MARARNIKPSIMDNDLLAELDPLARLLFIYLWMLADRDGRIEDRPNRIAAKALPYDRTADVDGMLNALQRAGFLLRYVADGKACIQILAFAKHQTPHVREAASELPSPEQATTEAVPKHNLGSAQASPRSPDTGYRIPDTGLTDTSSPPVHGADGADEVRGDGKPLTIQDLIGEGVDPQSAKDWLKVRAKKRAPLTLTAWNGLRREAAAAGYSVADAVRLAAESNWQTFKAEYVAKLARASPSGKPAWLQEREAQAAKWMGSAAPKRGDVIDMEATDAARLSMD